MFDDEDDAPLAGWPRDSYTGPGGGLYTGPGGGLHVGPGGGLYAGPCEKPYRNNWPPRAAFLEFLRTTGLTDVYELLADAWGFEKVPRR